MYVGKGREGRKGWTSDSPLLLFREILWEGMIFLGHDLSVSHPLLPQDCSLQCSRIAGRWCCLLCFELASVELGLCPDRLLHAGEVCWGAEIKGEGD